MPKRSYRKKSSRGKKGSRKGSKKSYRKKGSRKGSKKSYRKKGSKKSKRRRTIRKSRKASPCSGLDEAECGYNPNCEYKTNKYGTKYCKSRAGTLYKRKLSNKLTKVQGPMGPPPGHVKEEKKELDKAEVVLDKKEEKLEDAIVAGAPAVVIAELKEEVKEAKEVVEEKLEKLEEAAKEEAIVPDYEFNLAALGYRIRRRIKGSRGKKSRGKSRKISRGKKSRGKKSRGKKSRGKKSRRNSGFRSRHMM